MAVWSPKIRSLVARNIQYGLMHYRYRTSRRALNAKGSIEV